MKRKISLTETTFQSVRMTGLDDERNGDDKIELRPWRRRSRRGVVLLD